MSNMSLMWNVGLAIDIIHKNRGYCSFYVQIPRNKAIFML